MKVAVLTGKRGGIDAMRPMLQAMKEDSFFDLRIIACDQHLMGKFGGTGRDLSKDFHVRNVFPQSDGDDPLGRAINVAHYVEGIASALEYTTADLLMLYGDRGETVAGAIAATQMNVPIAHLQGGDKTGTMDDIWRHTISKMARIHFVSCEQSRMRLQTQGERNNVYVVGDSHIDPIRIWDCDEEGPPNIPSDYIILLLHPDSLEPKKAREQTYEAVQGAAIAARELSLGVICIYPCSDPGHRGVLRVLEAARTWENFQVFPNIPSRRFLPILRDAYCIVGNSSCGIIEAPYVETPAVMVGDRQLGRAYSKESTLFPDTNRFDIAEAIKHAEDKTTGWGMHYGDGYTGDRVIDILKTEGIPKGKSWA
jgi:UDP-hydrolysing UDP-N-acetyl-D-glucosamine 2-epimerase|tara:strand:- start:954 stop:2054 length:1101 start_codon:yes stop_codon:yes gene_type:complete